MIKTILVILILLLSSCASKVTVRTKRCYYMSNLKDPRRFTFDETHQLSSYGLMKNDHLNDLFKFKLTNGLTCQKMSNLNVTISHTLSDVFFSFIPFVDTVHVRYLGKDR